MRSQRLAYSGEEKVGNREIKMERSEEVKKSQLSKLSFPRKRESQNADPRLKHSGMTFLNAVR